MYAAMLDELRARVIDQIGNLPEEAMSYQPENTDLSIAVLVVHLVWAEAGWIQNMTGCQAPPALREMIDPVGSALPAERVPPHVEMGKEELVSLCEHIAKNYTILALRDSDIQLDTVIFLGTQSMTPRGIFHHLLWHWTYHSGQIGLIAEQWGGGYTWTFGTLGAG